MAQTTFSIAVSADDGLTEGSSATWPPSSANFAGDTGTQIVCGRSLAVGTYYIDCGHLRFDTSSIPDGDTVTAAILRLDVEALENTDSRSLTAEWHDAGTIDTTDYTNVVGTDAHAGTLLSAIVASTQNDFTLQNLSNINKVGYTGLRLHISGDQPSGENRVNAASWDHTGLIEPQLIVTHDPAGTAPTLRAVRSNQRW